MNFKFIPHLTEISCEIPYEKLNKIPGMEDKNESSYPKGIHRLRPLAPDTLENIGYD